MKNDMKNFSEIRLELDPNKILFCLNNEGELVYEMFDDMPDYEGIYQVSTFGRVKSLERKVRHYLGGLKIVKTKIMKPSNCLGYLIMNLSKFSKITSHKVHQLVAITFLGHKRCGFKIVVDHKDNIKTNNYEWNLQLITTRENTSKDRKGGTSKYIGVSWCNTKKIWRAQIVIKGISIHLGLFNKEMDAVSFYQIALSNIHLYDGNLKEFREALKNPAKLMTGLTTGKLVKNSIQTKLEFC